MCKTSAFRSFTKAVRQRYSEIGGKLTAVKLMKMLFFSCTIEQGLFPTFNNWWALPYGPVESDCYNDIQASSSFRNFLTSVDESTSSEENVENMLHSALEQLNNQGFFEKSEDELVEISHEWKEWQTAFYEAKQDGKKARKMHTENGVKGFYLKI